jgi:hypothetical protein
LPDHPGRCRRSEIRKFELAGLTPPTAKSLICRYVFAIQAARYVVGHAKAVHKGGLPASVGAVHRLLRDNGEHLDQSFYDRVVVGVRGLKGSLSVEALGAKVSVDLKGSAEGANASKQRRGQ